MAENIFEFERPNDPEGLTIRNPTHYTILEGDDGPKKQTMYFFYVKDFEEQELPAPYAQIMVDGNNIIITELYYHHAEAQAILDFFTAVHMLSIPPLLDEVRVVDHKT